jgi:two-component system response regulator FixJ
MKDLEPIIYIVDDDSAIRESLSLLLESENLRARSFASARDFLALDFLALDSLAKASGAECGCVVTDLRMPEMNGLELMAAMRSKGARLPVVMITAYADVGLAVQAMKAGAADFIEKPYRDEELVASVRAALAGDGADGATQTLTEDDSQHFADLNQREKEVLAGLLEGKLNKIIAHELGVSVRTVESVRANVMAKTGVSSLSELVRLCLLARR